MDPPAQVLGQARGEVGQRATQDLAQGPPQQGGAGRHPEDPGERRIGPGEHAVRSGREQTDRRVLHQAPEDLFRIVATAPGLRPRPGLAQRHGQFQIARAVAAHVPVDAHLGQSRSHVLRRREVEDHGDHAGVPPANRREDPRSFGPRKTQGRHQCRRGRARQCLAEGDGVRDLLDPVFRKGLAEHKHRQRPVGGRLEGDQDEARLSHGPGTPARKSPDRNAGAALPPRPS